MIKNVLIAAAAAALLATLFFWWFTIPPPPSAPVTAKTAELTGKLKAAKIDASFFDDPDFAGLELNPGPSPASVGRPNPFGPRR